MARVGRGGRRRASSSPGAGIARRGGRVRGAPRGAVPGRLPDACSNKYYVDEAVRGGLRRGARQGGRARSSGRSTRPSSTSFRTARPAVTRGLSWVSSAFDQYVVDGARERRRELAPGRLPPLPPGRDRARPELRAVHGRAGSSRCVAVVSLFDDEEGACMNSIPILSLVTYLPLVGALASSSSCRARKPATIKCVATRVRGRSTSSLSLPLWIAFDRRPRGLPVRRAGVLDPVARRRVPLRRGRDRALLILLTTLMGVIAIVCSYSAITERAEGVLRPAPPPPDLHDRHVLLPRPLPLLRVLGSDARPDVLPDRRLGRDAPALRRDQVLPLHARGLGRDAARRSSRSTSSTPRASSATRARATRRRSRSRH